MVHILKNTLILQKLNCFSLEKKKEKEKEKEKGGIHSDF